MISDVAKDLFVSIAKGRSMEEYAEALSCLRNAVEVELRDTNLNLLEKVALKTDADIAICNVVQEVDYFDDFTGTVEIQFRESRSSAEARGGRSGFRRFLDRLDRCMTVPFEATKSRRARPWRG